MGPDIVVAYLSSVIADGSLPATHVIVADDHQEFRDTGWLPSRSKVGLQFIATRSPHAFMLLWKPLHHGE